MPRCPMNAQQRRRRAHAIAYALLEQALKSGHIYSRTVSDESDADRRGIESALDSMAQRHFESSDRPSWVRAKRP